MKRVVALAVLGFVLSPPAAAARHSAAGLSIAVPSGWHVVKRRLTPCTNPIERIDLAGDGALVMLQEALDRAYVRRFPRRPRRFTLAGEPNVIACCGVARRKGWMIPFRDRGRSFYAYVYPGRAGSLRAALGALRSLRVTPP